MGKVGNGVKAGAVAGIAYGVVSAIFSYLALHFLKDQILNAIGKYISSSPILSNSGITAQSLYNAELSVGPIGAVIGGIIVGLILGIIFAYVYRRLPGKKGSMKGLSFGLILWIILGVLLGLAAISEYGMAYYELTVVGSLIGALIYGYFLGILYSRFQEEDTPLTDEPPFPQS